MSIYGAGANWKSLKQNVMLGGKQIQKIYVGDTLIYPSIDDSTEPISTEKFRYAIWAQLDDPIYIDVLRHRSNDELVFHEIPEPINRFGIYIQGYIANDIKKFKNYYAIVNRGSEEGKSPIPEVTGSFPHISPYISLKTPVYNPVYAYDFVAYDDRIVTDYFINPYKISFSPHPLAVFSYNNGKYPHMKLYDGLTIWQNLNVYHGTKNAVTIPSKECIRFGFDDCRLYVNPEDHFSGTTTAVKQMVIENWNRN